MEKVYSSKIRIKNTPNCLNPYTATLRGFGEYGWGKTPKEAKEKLIERLKENGHEIN